MHSTNKGERRMVRFSILGGGWRTECYLLAVRDLPEMFQIAGVYVRNPERRRMLAARYPVRLWESPEELLCDPGDFVVNIGSRTALPDITRTLLGAGAPVLSETPPAGDAEALLRLWADVKDAGLPFLVAEQCYARPYFRAVDQLQQTGLLGLPVSAALSMLHDYHGVSILRRLLRVGFEGCEVTGQYTQECVQATCGREGLVQTREEKNPSLLSACLRFEGGRTAFYRFCGEQYFSLLRSNHLQVCCRKGEVFDNEVRYLSRSGEGMLDRLVRVDLGHVDNLEGYSHRGITFCGEFLYKNPFAERALTAPRRLSDDEIAICECLLDMKRCVDTGKASYPAAEAFQDAYLALLMQEAARSGQALHTQPMPWAAEG